MYDLPLRRRISLILVKLGPAHEAGKPVFGELDWQNQLVGKSICIVVFYYVNYG